VIFKAVIFDLDGTLLNTLEDLADAMNIVLKKNRLPVHDLEAYRYFVGEGIDMLVRRALPFEVPDADVLRRFTEQMKSEYARCWTQKTRPYPGIPEMLKAFAAAGFEMAVLSNKPDEATRHLTQAYFPDAPFRQVMGACPARPKKPDPAAALEIARLLQFEPSRCIFMGDSAIDMRTASAAGMFPLGALWGFRPAEELMASGARMLCGEPVHVIPWL
jgi:phosphoglycolate phosphatase